MSKDHIKSLIDISQELAPSQELSASVVSIFDPKKNEAMFKQP
jgi:hypothetical protein